MTEHRPARIYIEAQCGLNDVWPGDPYPAGPTILYAPRHEVIEECAKLIDIEVVAIIKAGNQFDKNGDIYGHIPVLQGVAEAIRALAHPSHSAVRPSEEAPSTAGGEGKSEHPHAPGLSLPQADHTGET